MVVAAVEVVVVETVEVELLLLGQCLVHILVLHGDARVPTVVALMVDEEQLFVADDAVGLDFLAAQAECGRKLSHEPRLLRHGNFPNAEEAQHVVDAVGIEVFSHLAETPYPPLAAVLQHLVPVVGREAPVLAFGRERIGRSTGLSVEVEVFRLHPCLDTVAADADGDVAFQDDPVLAGILVGGMHLLVEVVLYEIPELQELLILEC